jgi:uncharacterized protein YecE (DUF72 family)
VTDNRHQLDLFPDPPLDVSADLALAAKRLPGLSIGTSSWTFPGWAQLVYRGHPTQESLVESGLEEYSRHPLFNTVGIDRSFYAPLKSEELIRYAAQLPPDFRCVIKVWNNITSPVDYATKKANPYFFHFDVFKEFVLEPLHQHFEKHVNCLLFQLPPTGTSLSLGELNFKLRRFFEQMPKALPCAVEVRTLSLLKPQYFETLKALGVAHCFNHWEGTPSIAEQLEMPGAISSAPHVLARLLLPQGHGYEEMREAFSPFNRLQVIDEKMRNEVLSLWRICQTQQKSLTIIVNNKAEGCSPLTVRALWQKLSGPER